MANRNRVSGIAGAIFCWTIVNNLQSGISEVGVTVSAVKMSIRPIPQWEGTADALISYNVTKPESYAPWTRSLETFINDYKTFDLVPGRKSNVFVCDYDQPPPPGRLCNVDVREMDVCISENHFGYHRASPCIFLKIDTPPGWMPEFYNDTGSLPAGMPADLKSYITSSSFSVQELNTVWVSCEGVYPADKEFIGPVRFNPRRGFPGYYFLNNQAEGYLSPIVALQVHRPSTGIVINIKCKAWARNIDEDGVQFSLMID